MIGMIDATLLLVMLQDAGVEPQTAATSIVSALVQALTVGGGIAVAGTFLLKEIGKRLDYQRDARKEEQDLDRSDRERQFQQYKDLFASYVARQDRVENTLEAQIDRLVVALDAERTRYDTMVKSVLSANGTKDERP